MPFCVRGLFYKNLVISLIGLQLVAGHARQNLQAYLLIQKEASSLTMFLIYGPVNFYWRYTRYQNATNTIFRPDLKALLQCYSVFTCSFLRKCLKVIFYLKTD